MKILILLITIGGFVMLNALRAGSLIEATFFVENNGERMVKTLKIKQNNSTESMQYDCFIYGERHVIQWLLSKKSPSIPVETLTKYQMNEQIYFCNNFLLDAVRRGRFPNVRPLLYHDKKFNRFQIFPGTKWCGAGNISDNFQEFGDEIEMDKCCKTYHFCNDVIPVFSTKYGLKNMDMFPKKSCQCEENFYNCLKRANTTVSHKMGETYYNELPIQCFKKDYPIVKCLKKKWLPYHKSICQEYQLDKTKPKIYQFFDTKYYVSPPIPYPDYYENNFV